jgi:cytochrome c-type biogenesis protein CcmF
MVRWIWLGALFMTLGGFVAATDRRYRRVNAAAKGPAEASVPLPEGARA